ncbi:MAG TPA: ATP-dependent DNA helicase RecQ [Bacteroidia bacterium]|nr:ATP-dependent DNA helicase RecQ [Bacteroidia bacterium]
MKEGLKKDIHTLLRKYWAYEDFRPLQEDIILSVLQGHDTLALLPTGGGKSICFQIAGLKLGGTVLVVSPLISLMNDQVQNLRKRGLSAVAIHAAMNYREIDIAMNNAALGHVQFLYVSPERLEKEDFRIQLSHLPITLIAVDEAHCISQWGYDFRPSYLKVAELRTYFSKVQVLALTASATEDVVEDIQLRLKFRKKNVFRQSFERNNLRYVVQLEENKGLRLLKLIRSLGGSGIVYVRNRKLTESTSLFLRNNGISSKAYHAGLNYDQRQTIQEDWTGNKVQVICATNAFGMGIDKPDVRFVVHLDLPDSLEAYFQEAGRAGRDGHTAYAALFYSASDQQKLREQHELSFPEPELIKKTYQALCNYYQVAMHAGQGLCVDFELDKICSSYNLFPVQVFNSVKFLEKEDYLSLLDQGFEPSRLMFLASKETVYEFQIRHPRFDILIKTLLRSYGGLYEHFVHISEKDLAYRCKISQNALVEQLQFLNKQELIMYLPQSSVPKLVFLQNRIQAGHLEFSKENYHRLKENARAKIQAVLDYSNNTRICRQVQLLMYFNEIDHRACGHCDVCLSKKPGTLKDLKKKLSDLLSERSMSMEELKTSMRTHRDESWVQALNELIDDELVEEEGQRFRIKT